MANLTAVISADTSKFVGGIKSAQEMLNKFVKDTNSASDSTKRNIAATDEQVAAYQRVIKQLEKVGSGTMNTNQQQKALTEQIKELKVQWQNLSDSAKSSEFGKSMADTMKLAKDELDKLKSQLGSIDDIKPTGNLKNQLRLTTTELQNLTAQYRALSAAEKESPFGAELAQKMDELRQKAGTLQDTIGDVQQEIKTAASDTPNLDVFNEALSLGGSMLSTYSSLVAKLTGDEKALQDAIATIATVQSVCNLATKTANALQSSSVLMLKVRKIQEGALAVGIRIRTAAESKGTIATRAATAAQAAFNIVAKANPYVLLATAIIAAGAALIAFTKKNKEAKEAEEKHQEQLKKEQEAFEDYTNEVGNGGGKLLAKYQLLKAEYQSLSSEHEKTNWIKKNKDAFSDLGISVNSLSDAERIYVQNTGTVVDAIIKRAQAAAKQTQINQLAERMLAERERAEAEYARRQVRAGGEVGGTSHNSATGNEYVDRNTGKWVYTAKGAEEANKRIHKEVFAAYNSLEAEMQRKASELAGSIDVSTLFTSGGSGGNKTTVDIEPVIVEGSLAEANKKVNELKAQLENLNPSDENFAIIHQQLEDWKKKQAELNELINGTKEKVQETEDEVSKLVSGSLNEASYFVKSISEQLANMNPNDEGFQDMLDLLNEWKKKQDEITKSINGTNEAVKEIESGKSAVESFLQTYDKLVGSAANIVGSFNSVYEAFKGLDDKLEEAKPGWERFFAVFEAGMAVLSSIANMMEGINAIMEVFNTIKAASTAITDKDTASSIANATAKTTEAGANTLEAGTAGAAAAAEAGKSVASVPYVGPILAIAAIASVMAAIIGVIASSKGFAGGGIIDGATSIGDYNLARVNNGEMILNGTQQKRLFNLLDGNSGFGSSGNVGGQVEFKLKGTELIGVINNVNKKRSKV